MADQTTALYAANTGIDLAFASAMLGQNPGVFPCVKDCIDTQCGGGGVAVQCGFLDCSGTDPILYKACADACSTSCGGTPPGPGPGPGGTVSDSCVGPLGVVSCTVKGIAGDIAQGGRDIGGLVQGLSKNMQLILVLLIGVVALVGFQDVKSLRL